MNTPEKLGNWIAHIGGYGQIGFWQCTRAEATRVAAMKAEWEGGGYRVRPAKDTPEDNERLMPGRAGCYDVGERKS